MWMGRLLVIGLCVAALGTVAMAEPYGVTWEGDTYPEQDGWKRTVRGGGAERSFVDGSLVLDGLASTDIVDDYYMLRTVYPDPGEGFVMEWRLRVDDVQGYADPVAAISSDDRGGVFLIYTEGAIRSMLEGIWIPFTPGEFHTYSFVTTDMVSYELRIDGVLAHAGRFVGPLPDSGVTWGDGVQGASSLSQWDYVRFGIVPEPHAAALLLGSASLAVGIARARGACRKPPAGCLARPSAWAGEENGNA
jgi:hypothetical protein